MSEAASEVAARKQPTFEGGAELRPLADLLGEAGLLAVVAGLLVAVPGALRASGGGVLAWVALAGCAALVLGPLVISGQRARLTLSSAAPLVGVLLAVAPLMVFGQLLEAKTNHRPLGAATFAILSLGLILASVVGVSALSNLARRRGRDGLARALLLGLGSLALLVAGRQTVAGMPGGGLGRHLLDGALLIVLPLALALSGRTLRLPAAAAKVGRLLWPALVVAGLALVALRPGLGSLLQRDAPVVLGAGAWFAG